jgi:hypothetical protein
VGRIGLWQPVHNLCTPKCPPCLTPLQFYLWWNLWCLTPLQCIQKLDYTVPRHVWPLQQPNCLVWSKHLWSHLIPLWQLLLFDISIMIGCTLCSITPLCSCSCMSLSSSGLTRVFQWWGGVRSTQQSQTPSQPGTTLHSWGDVWYIRQFWPDTHSWLVMLVYQKMMCLSPWTQKN